MKTRGLTLVFTGEGKGKTTAAFGTALRVLGCGGRVGTVQFFKYPAGNEMPGKEGAFRALRKFKNRFRIWSFGGGFTWKTPREVNAKTVRKAWKQCRKLLKDPKYDLVILDEIHIALRYKFLKTADVIKVLKKRPALQHVILTGRGAPRRLIKAADLVTEMRCVKHSFHKGVLAQPGIEF